MREEMRTMCVAWRDELDSAILRFERLPESQQSAQMKLYSHLCLLGSLTRYMLNEVERGAKALLGTDGRWL